MDDSAVSTLFDSLDKVITIILLITQWMECTSFPFLVDRSIKVLGINFEQLCASLGMQDPVD